MDPAATFSLHLCRALDAARTPKQGKDARHGSGYFDGVSGGLRDSQ